MHIPWPKSWKEVSNLPNCITYIRLGLTILTTWWLLLPGWREWAAFGVFIVAASTDWVDGWVAKRNNGRLSTDWGKFIDPIVDKVLMLATMGVMIVRVDPTLFVRATVPLQAVLIVCLTGFITREIGVMWFKSQQPVKSAGEAGRMSMVLQVVAGVLMLLAITLGNQTLIDHATFVLCMALGASLASGVVYGVEWWAFKHTASQTQSAPTTCLLVSGVMVSAALIAFGFVHSANEPAWVTHLPVALFAATAGALACAAWAYIAALLEQGVARRRAGH